MNNMLTIIVPIYKIEEFLPQCIDSILVQTYSDYELILVDDGSPDLCPAICDKYAKKDSRIKVIHKANGGLVSARKAGLQVASGKFIGYVDGDDWVEPDFFEKLMRKAVDNDVDIVSAGFIKDMGDNCTNKLNSLACGYYSKTDIEKIIIPQMMFNDYLFEPGLFTYVWNKVFKREVLFEPQMNVPNSISLGEDAACLYPAIIKARSLYITDECLYHYRQRADSMLKVSESYNEDYIGYKQLYSHFIKCFENHPFLKYKSEKFLLYLISTRCGGVVFDKDVPDFYLFDNQPKGRKIAVYGAGTLGQHLYKRLLNLNAFSITKWVDIDYMELRKHGLPVDKPDSIYEVDFDELLIAFLDTNLVSQKRDELICNGIPEEKIISADFLSVDCKAVLKHIGVISK